MENALFIRSALAVTCVLKTPSWWYLSGEKRPPRSEERSHPWPFLKRKRTLKAAPSSLRKRLRISFSLGHTESSINVPLCGPLYEQPVGCSGTVQRDLCSATRNQTFSGGEEKLLFSCANFVDQTKSARSK